VLILASLHMAIFRFVKFSLKSVRFLQEMSYLRMFILDFCACFTLFTPLLYLYVQTATHSSNILPVHARFCPFTILLVLFMIIYAHRNEVNFRHELFLLHNAVSRHHVVAFAFSNRIILLSKLKKCIMNPIAFYKK